MIDHLVPGGIFLEMREESPETQKTSESINCDKYSKLKKVIKKFS